MNAPQEQKGTIYIVIDADAPAGTPPRLVLALSQAQAIRHVTRPRYSARPLGSLEVAAYMGEPYSLKVETAKAEVLQVAGSAS